MTTVQLLSSAITTLTDALLEGHKARISFEAADYISDAIRSTARAKKALCNERDSIADIQKLHDAKKQRIADDIACGARLSRRKGTV